MFSTGRALWYLGVPTNGNDLSVYREVPGQVPVAVGGFPGVRLGLSVNGLVLVQNAALAVQTRLYSDSGTGTVWQSQPVNVTAGDGATWFLGPEFLNSENYIYRWASNGVPTFTDKYASNLVVTSDGSIMANPASSYRWLRVGSSTGPGTYWALLPNTSPKLNVLPSQTNGSFLIAFTNDTSANFSVLVSTNLLLPLTNWINLGPPTEEPSGTFQFTVPFATNAPQLFYRIQSP